MLQPKAVKILTILLMLAGCSSNQYRAPVDSREQPPSQRISTHTVARGDTLYSIAWRYNLDVRTLAQANGIAEASVIRPGQRINLDPRNTAQPARAQTQLVSRPAPAQTPPQTTAPGSANASSSASSSRSNKRASSSSAARPDSRELRWQWPVNGRIISRFAGPTALNKGIDIAAKKGEPVLAAETGAVVYAGDGLRGYGNLLIIKHNDNYLSAYAHNHRLLVKEGDQVKMGQQIAEVGSSGTNTDKLHFEIRRDGTPVDPLRYLSSKE